MGYFVMGAAHPAYLPRPREANAGAACHWGDRFGGSRPFARARARLSDGLSRHERRFGKFTLQGDLGAPQSADGLSVAALRSLTPESFDLPRGGKLSLRALRRDLLLSCQDHARGIPSSAKPKEKR